jgi:hypothetical protein
MTHVGTAYTAMRFLGMLRHGKISHPFEQRLFFAGEATNANDCSTAMALMTAAFAPRTKRSQP